MFWVRRKPGWLCILPQDGRVTLAHVVRAHGARPQVRLLDSFALAGDTADALRRLRASHRLDAYACTSLLAPGEAHVTQLEAPAVPREERREALRWALKEMVPYPVDKACLEILDIPGEGLPYGRSAGVLAVSADEQVVRARVAPFVAARVSLDVLDAPELAQRNVAALFEEENRGLAFLRIDEAGMMLTLSFRGELVAVRRGEITSRQLGSGDAEQQARARERLTLEVQRSLDNFDRQYSHLPVSRLVVACSPPLESLLPDLVESTYVPVLEMDLAPLLDCSAVPELRAPGVQAANLLALGAALRSGEGAA